MVAAWVGCIGLSTLPAVDALAAPVQTGFQEDTVFSGLTQPTAIGSPPTAGSSWPRRAG